MEKGSRETWLTFDAPAAVAAAASWPLFAEMLCLAMMASVKPEDDDEPFVVGTSGAHFESMVLYAGRTAERFRRADTTRLC